MKNIRIASAVFWVALMMLGCVVDQTSKIPYVTEAAEFDRSAFYLPQEDITAVYHKAYIATQLQGPQSKLRIICQVKLDWGYVTFVGAEEEKIIFVAFTEHKFRSPSKNLRTGGHLPRGATLDWGYVFDRNNDGKVDYFTFLNGPMPVVPEDWEGDLPNKNAPHSTEEIEFMLNNMEVDFWHLADDNFDGFHDGVAVSLLDLDTGWIDGLVVARDTDFDGNYDSCRTFNGRMHTETGECEGSHAGFHVPNKEFSGCAEIPPPRWFFKQINEAAEKCRLTGEFFYGSED